MPIDYADFEKVEIHVGTVLTCEPNVKAKKPAYVLTIDFGPLGIKTSSAQLTQHYTPETLIGRQVVAVTNFAPKKVAGVASEVLVLGAVNDEQGVILLAPTLPVHNGTRVS